MRTELILITSEFPFAKAETFLEIELPYLEEAFQKVTVISLSPDTRQTRKVGIHTNVISFPIILNRWQKLKAMRWLIQRPVLIELWRLCFRYKLVPSPKRIFTILLSWDRAYRLSEYLKTKVSGNTIAYAYWSDDSALALAQLKHSRPELRCVSRFHGWDVYFEVSQIGFLPFRNYIHKQLDVMFAISQAGATYARKYWKLDGSDSIKVCRLGSIKRIDEFRKKDCYHAEKLIVSCSSVIPLKRVELIFDMLNALSIHTIRWVHFGDGPGLNSLKERVKLTCKSHLSVELRGHQRNEDILDFYLNERPEFFVNMSTSEGIPVSIMEAMSCGIPVIATNVGGTSESVTSETGWLIELSTKFDDMNQIMEGCLNISLEEWHKKSSSTFSHWQENFNSEKNNKTFVKELNL